MAFQPAPFIVGAVIESELPERQTMDLDLNFSRGGIEPTILEMSTLSLLIANWFVADLLPSLCDTVIPFQVIVTQLGLVNGFQVGTGITGAAGGIGTEQMPNAMALCVSFRSGVRGRSFRGRNYVSGVPTAEVDVNDVSTTFVDDMVNGYLNLLPGGAFDPTPFRWVVLSRRFAGALRANGIGTDIVDVFVTDNVIDDQRRRKPGVGK